MSRVMISYSTKRRSIADGLHARLRDVHSLSPKLDHLDLSAGDRWRETIAYWLSACQTAVVLLCPDALKSPWVRYELSVLVNRELTERNLRLIVVCLGGVDHQRVARRRAFRPHRLAEHLLDVGRMTAFDSRAISVLDELSKGRNGSLLPAVLFAAARTETAEIAAKLVQVTYRRNKVFCFVLQGGITGTAEQIADGLHRQLVGEIARKHPGEDVDEVMGVLLEVAIRCIWCLLAPKGLTQRCSDYLDAYLLPATR